MKFSDIDFDALGRMMDSMSDEEKESLNNMANEMMDNMQQQEEEEDLDIYEFLHIDEEEYNDLPVLDLIENAVELEDFYDGDQEADYSASVLFYAKAVLKLLRNNHYPIYKNVLHATNFTNPATTTIYSYLFPLMSEDTIQQLVNEHFGTKEAWIAHKNALQQIYILLNRAEYDTIHYADLQSLKDLLFEQKELLRITELV